MAAEFQDWFMPFAGLAGGTALGIIARAQRFCTMSALERYWFGNEASGLRTWALAAATALLSTQALIFAGLIDLSQAFYLTAGFSPLAAIAGGIAFGFGMALTGTCGFGALVRVGGGNLRSLIVIIVLGLSALAIQRGALAPMRIAIGHYTGIDLAPLGGQSIPALASGLIGVDVVWPLTGLITLALFYWIFRDRDYRRNGSAIATGAGIGAVVSFGWLATAWGHVQSFEPIHLEAASFVMPVGDAVSYLANYTGLLPDYGVGVVAGVMLGAALVANWRRDVRWEACDDARELGRHLAGAVLMGLGGVLAMGCTIGQGVSAVSVMAISSPIVLASVAVGAKLGLAYLLEGSPWRAFSIAYSDPAE